MCVCLQMIINVIQATRNRTKTTTKKKKEGKLHTHTYTFKKLREKDARAL
jgi:hypothetical protein